LMARTAQDVRPAQPSTPALEALHKCNKRLMVGEYSRVGARRLLQRRIQVRNVLDDAIILVGSGALP